MRQAVSTLAFKVARGSQQASLFFGGIAGLGFVIALVMLIFNPKHGAAHYGDLTVSRSLWVFPSIVLAACFVGFRWLPALLGRLGVWLLPHEDRLWLAAAVDVSLQTGEPIPSLEQLRRERDEYRASGELGLRGPDPS